MLHARCWHTTHTRRNCNKLAAGWFLSPCSKLLGGLRGVCERILTTLLEPCREVSFWICWGLFWLCQGQFGLVLDLLKPVLGESRSVWHCSLQDLPFGFLNSGFVEVCSWCQGQFGDKFWICWSPFWVSQDQFAFVPSRIWRLGSF